MWNDEFLSFYSDGVATFKQVILVQLHHPISLDPPTYHLLSHLSMDILGRNAIALRLPALAGFLLFQLCLFFFVRRLAGDRAAIIAMAVPLLTASFRYSLEGRPYGLLLGLYALSLLCWQIATQDDDNASPAPASSPSSASPSPSRSPSPATTSASSSSSPSHSANSPASSSASVSTSASSPPSPSASPPSASSSPSSARSWSTASTTTSPA